MHSPNYEKVKRYFRLKLWNETRVRYAVKKGWITEEEFRNITGIPYNEVPGAEPASDNGGN